MVICLSLGLYIIFIINSFLTHYISIVDLKRRSISFLTVGTVSFEVFER